MLRCAPRGIIRSAFNSRKCLIFVLILTSHFLISTKAAVDLRIKREFLAGFFAGMIGKKKTKKKNLVLEMEIRDM